MKPGLRLQILLLLGALLTLALVPLFFAVATYTSVALTELRTVGARSLGRAVASHISDARGVRSPAALVELLESQVGIDGVESLTVYDRAAKRVASVGPQATLPRILDHVRRSEEASFSLPTRHGAGLAIVLPSDHGSVVAILRTDTAVTRAAPLVRLVGLYTSVFALLLLIVSYFALTRFIVRPVDQLSRAARRVAGGARRLDVPETGSRELLELGASLRTMTERLIAEEEALRKKVAEVERTTATLQQTQKNLVQSERLASVGRLSAGLAHEVGNPIAAILGMQDLMLDGCLTAGESRDFLTRMRKDTERINTIIKELLQFARSSDELVGKGNESGSVEIAVHETVTLLRSHEGMAEVEVTLDLYPDLPAIPLPTAQLVQVLVNLMLNAADACDGQGEIRIAAGCQSDIVTILVEDTGPGISPEVRDLLFEPFVTTKDVGDGTGLGLSVCAGLIKAVRGTIEVDPDYQGGARFRIELPAVRSDDKQLGGPDPSSS